MIEAAYLFRFVVALVLGVLMGIDRERKMLHNKKLYFAGIRTYMFITLYGAISAYFAQLYGSIFLVVAFSIIGVLTIVSYWIISVKHREPGGTSELAIFMAFFVGVLCAYGEMIFGIILAIIITLILASKSWLHKFTSRVSREDIVATIKFAVIAFVILPFLPNKTYGPLSVLNPYIIWLMIVFISGISFAAYVLMKMVGTKKGIGITSFLGGFVSSTAVAMGLSAQSKRVRQISNPFVFGILLASSMMFIRVLVEVAVLNKALLKPLLVPMIAMAAVGLLFALYFWTRKSKAPTSDLDLKSPFSLGPALKFGIFFAIILFVSKAAQIYLGSIGVYGAAIISALADVDAVTVSMAQLAGTEVTNKVAVTAITIAACVNTAVKGGIVVMFGSKAFKKKILLPFISVLLVGLISALLFV